jgi:hypothetical protein
MKIRCNLTKTFYSISMLSLIVSQQLYAKNDNQVQATPINLIAQAQGTDVPSQSNRVIIVVFTGFASQTINETTGMQKLVDAFRQEAKLDQSNLKMPIFAWDGRKDAISYLNSLGLKNNDKLIVIGHSYGGDTAILLANELKKRNRRVDLLIQVDSVGSSDDVLPSNVAKGINYYQADDNPMSIGRFKVQQEVINSTNLDVNRVFRNELITNNNYPLNHGSIDDSNEVHQAIIQQVLNAVANKNPTPQVSCQATVDKVLQEIRFKGVNWVKFRIDKGVANEGRIGNPMNRTDVLIIALSSMDWNMTTRPDPKIGSIIINIMESTKLMKSWADRIVATCSNTAIVAFNVYGSDNTVEYYIQSDGTTKLNKCVEPPYIPYPRPWGVTHCL